MAPIFYVVFSGFIYAIGQVTAPNPRVSLIKDGEIIEERAVVSPVIVNVDGDRVEVRGAKPGLTFVKAKTKAPAQTSPLRKDPWGNWTADCHPAHCEE